MQTNQIFVKCINSGFYSGIQAGNYYCAQRDEVSGKTTEWFKINGKYFYPASYFVTI